MSFAVVVALLVVWVAPPDPAAAALRLVPPGTAIGVVVRDLRSHGTAIVQSPFATWLQSTPLLKQLADPGEVRKVADLIDFLAGQAGVTVEGLVADLVGDVVVFAYQPGPPGKPEAESGLVIVQARKPDLIAKLIGKLNELQVQTGEIKLVEKEHRGRAYRAREKPAGGVEYYLLRDGLFAYSAQESAITRVIDADLDSGPNAQSRMATGIAKLGLAGQLAVGWIDPRAFDADLAARATAATTDNEKAFLTRFRDVWAALDDVALYLHPDTGLEVGLAAAVERKRLPKELRDAIRPGVGGSAILASVPADALMAVGGRVQLAELLTAASAFLPRGGQDSLKTAIDQGLGPFVGRDKLPALFAGLGPDWALWATPPAQGAVLPTVTAAIKLSPSPNQDLAKTVRQGLDAFAQIIRVNYNKSHTDQFEFDEDTRNGVTVKFLANDAYFPVGVRPSYALRDGYLVMGSSPAAVWNFQPPTAPAGASDGPILRLNAALLRAYATEHRGSLTTLIAAAQSKSATDVDKELGDLLGLISAVNTIELRQSVGDGRLRLNIRIELVKPLRK